MFQCGDEECIAWREKARGLLVGFEVLDPMDRDYREIEGRSFRRVVEEDKGDIDSCDIVLASCHRESAGTSMEILYAWERGKDVYLILDKEEPEYKN